MMRKLVWLAGITGYLAFDLAVGSALPGPLVFVVLLVAVLLGGMVMGLIIGMAPRRYSPGTRYDRLKLLAAFFVAGLIGAVLGMILPLGIATWFPAGLIGLALLAFTFRLGSRQREAVEEPARDEA